MKVAPSLSVAMTSVVSRSGPASRQPQSPGSLVYGADLPSLASAASASTKESLKVQRGIASWNYVAEVAKFEVAPRWRFCSVLKDTAVPIQRLPKTCGPEARPVDGALLEHGLRFRGSRLNRPGEHYKAVVGLDPSQTRIERAMRDFNH